MKKNDNKYWISWGYGFHFKNKFNTTPAQQWLKEQIKESLIARLAKVRDSIRLSWYNITEKNINIINAKKIDPKWFVYVPNDGSNRYKAKFEPALEVAPTRKEMSKQVDCTSMFLEGCRTILQFCLGM